MHDMSRASAFIASYDGALGHRIIDTNMWVVAAGLRGDAVDRLLDGLCRRLLEAGAPLWRAFAGMRTLHPQWGGYGYTWERDRDGVRPWRYERGGAYEHRVLTSPFGYLAAQAEASGDGNNPWWHLRRRLAGPEAQLDFPILEELASAGGTDYLAGLAAFGRTGDLSRGTGAGLSFATDRKGGFGADDLALLRAVLPAAALALMTDAGHTIAAGLLAAYLGGDAGGRVHRGAVARGSVDSIRAVLWYADIRGFTAIADVTPGRAVVALLDDVFEALTAALRPRGGQVLKFLGDGMLAIFPLDDGAADRTCRAALDAAREAMRAIDRLKAGRRAVGKPAAEVDLALHLGQVLYGNVGAADRLDFTVIGLAVNEAARIELLCEPLGCKVLVSAELAAAVPDAGLRRLGRHRLRGVRETRELYALDIGD
jgi:adenylate cyclase